MTMANRDKVFAQNWIEQMREEFAAHCFDEYVGRPLTYVYAFQPDTYVNCFWWVSDYPWHRREDALLGRNLVQ